MDRLNDTMANLSTNTKPRTLLTLPPEIRIKCYAALLRYSDPISLYINDQGAFSLGAEFVASPEPTPNPVHFLQTCRQVHDEASVFFYSMNVFDLYGECQDHLHRLQMPLKYRMCIQRLRLRCTIDTKLSFSVISEGFPALQNLHVLMSGPGSGLLLTALEVSDSIPNSPAIRPWPQFFVVAEVCQDKTIRKQHENSIYQNPPDDSLILNGHEGRYRMEKKLHDTLKGHKYDLRLGSHVRPHCRSLCGIGRGMPVHLQTITLRGTALAEHVQAISSHECAFGDCGFHELGSELVTENSQDQSQDEYQKHTYVWQKRGDLADATAIEERDLIDNAALMHQWVPGLSTDFLKALMGDNVEKPDEPARDQGEPPRMLEDAEWKRMKLALEIVRRNR